MLAVIDKLVSVLLNCVGPHPTTRMSPIKTGYLPIIIIGSARETILALRGVLRVLIPISVIKKAGARTV